MRTQHNSNIFCISFDAAQRRLYSGGNDEMVIIHNIETGESIEQIGYAQFSKTSFALIIRLT